MLQMLKKCGRLFTVSLLKIWSQLFVMYVDRYKFNPTIKHDKYPVLHINRNRLACLPRKTLVLDLDETLVHSNQRDFLSQPRKPDFVVETIVNNKLLRFYVHKRPHVDYFLETVARWYDLAVYTASIKPYGNEIANRLDNGRGLLPRRFFRQHCKISHGIYVKNLALLKRNMSSVFAIDNTAIAYKEFPDNLINIVSWYQNQTDVELLVLLPFLDALRFTRDVRTILSRNLQMQRHRSCNKLYRRTQHKNR